MELPTIPSPCIRVCTLDDTDTCIGCFRTMDEILAWGGASDPVRKEILANCKTRAAEYAERYPNRPLK